MTINEWKKVARTLKEVYKALETEAVASGVSVLSKEYDEVIAKARLKVLEKFGFTLDEYRKAKEKATGQGVALQLVEEVESDIKHLKNRHIPSEKEIERIAERVAKKYIVPPKVTNKIINQIVKEVTVEKPIKETVIHKEEYDPSELVAHLGYLEDKINKLPKPEKIDIGAIRNEFEQSLKDSIEIEWGQRMPDFRKLAMGLQQQIEEHSGGVGVGGQGVTTDTAINLGDDSEGITQDGVLTSQRFINHNGYPIVHADAARVATGNAAAGIHSKVLSLESGSTDTFNEWIGTNANAGVGAQNNFTYYRGFNIDYTTGALSNTAKHGWSEGFEYWYEPTAGLVYAERHLVLTQTGGVGGVGVPYRVESYTLPVDDPEDWSLYHTLNTYFIKSSVDGGSFLNISRTSSSITNFQILVSGQTSKGTELLVTNDGTNNSLQINPYGASTGKSLSMSQWYDVALPSLTSLNTPGDPNGKITFFNDRIYPSTDNDCELGATGWRFKQFHTEHIIVTSAASEATVNFEVTALGAVTIKAPTVNTSLTGSYLTASELLITDADKKIVSAPVATYPSLTELTYLKGVTSAIQTQINSKQATLSLTTTGSSGAATLVGATLNIPNYTLSGLGGANTALSNLSSVAVNTSIVSDTDSTDNLGSATISWDNIYVDSVVTTNIGADVADNSPFVIETAVDTQNADTTALYIYPRDTTNHRLYFGKSGKAIYAINLTNVALWEGTIPQFTSQLSVYVSNPSSASIGIANNLTGANDTPAILFNSTWNTSGVARLIDTDITNTASAAGSFFLRFAENSTERFKMFADGSMGINTSAADKQLEINSATGNNLRLTYNDNSGSAANYTDFTLSSSGDLTITPSGGDVAIAGNLALGSGASTGIVSSSGNNDLTLQTGNATTGSITLVDGANGDINITANGSGGINLNTGTGDIVLTSNTSYIDLGDDYFEASTPSAGYKFDNGSAGGVLDFSSTASSTKTFTFPNTSGTIALTANPTDITVPDEAYGSGWNGSLEVPTKNAIYDKIESLGGATTVEVSLSSANITGMFATPVEVIAGVAGKIPMIVSCLLFYDYGGTQYTSGGTMRLQEETSGTTLVASIALAADINGAADHYKSSEPALAVARTLGKGVFVTNASGAFATGNGTMKLYITYQMITPA